MAENIGFDESSNDFGDGSLLSNGGEVINQQLKFFAHVTSLSENGSSVYKSGKNTSVGCPHRNPEESPGVSSVIEVKQEPVESAEPVNSDEYCAANLTVGFYNNSISSVFLPPNYVESDDSSGSVSSWSGVMAQRRDDENDVDYQPDTEDEDVDTASDPEDKCPDPDYDDSEDTDDSDYVPRKSRRKKSKPAGGRGKGSVAKIRKRESYQDKIDRLKKSIADMDYMKINSGASVDQAKDVSYLQILLSKGQNELTRALLAKKLQINKQNANASKKDQEDVKRVVEDMLRKRNLLPQSFGPETSHATVMSYANILRGSNENSFTEAADQPQTAANQSASQLLQSLSQNVRTKDKTQPEQISDHASVSFNSSQKKLDGLSGRSCLLLQHLLLKDGPKIQTVEQATLSSSSLATATKGSTGDSVLKSMLTAKTHTIQHRPAHRSGEVVKVTLLRNLLETPQTPLEVHNRKQAGIPHVDDCENDCSSDQCELVSSESFEGYMVYVDHAASEEDSEVPENADTPKTHECTDSCHGQITIKSEPLLEPAFGENKTPEAIAKAPVVTIKSEALSPCSESNANSLGSENIAHSSQVQSETAEHQDQALQIKKEPKSPTSTGCKYEKDSELDTTTGNQAKTSGSVGSFSDFEPLGNQSDHESQQIKIKSEPLSPSHQDMERVQIESQKYFSIDQPSEKTSLNIHNNNKDKTLRDTFQFSKLNDLMLRNLLKNNDSSALLAVQKPKTPERYQSSADDSQTKPGRPCHKQTLSQKINSLKRMFPPDGSSSSTLGGVSTPFLGSAAAHLQSLSRSRSNSKETILRGVMDGSSTSVLGLDSPDVAHSYNTRHKKKQDNTSLLEKALKMFNPTFPVLKNEAPQNLLQKETSPVSDASSVSSGVCKEESDQKTSDTGVFTQNASCSQQLLNIIKNVGATQKSRQNISDSSEKNVTILKSMLNDDLICRASVTDSACTLRAGSDEPNAKFPRLAKTLRKIAPKPSQPDMIERSVAFLNQNRDSRPASPGVHPKNKVDANQSRILMMTNNIATSRGNQKHKASTNASKQEFEENSSEDMTKQAGLGVNNRQLAECPYQCRLCGSAFRSTSLLEEHMQVHFGAMPFGCSLCPKSFMTVMELEEHMKVHMSNLSPALVYKCTVCGEVFDTEYDHNQHRMSHRTGDQTKYTCCECRKVFATEKQIAAHLESHRTSVKKCEICLVQCENEKEYQQHKEAVHKKQELKCEYCSEVFHVHSKYARHLTRHTGHKEYKCKKCDKGFVSKNGMIGHVAKCQGRPYTCTGCKESFIRKAELTNHILNVHGLPGVRCEYCHKLFCYRVQLEEHQKEHKQELGQKKEEETEEEGDSDSQGTNNDCLGTQNKVTFSVQRSSGPAHISGFSVQCLSDKAEDSEVVTISDSD